jgi:hypothetical protein
MRLDYESPIHQQLEPGERLLWVGRPRQGFFLRGSDAFYIPFSIVWGGFALFWETMVLTSLVRARGAAGVIGVVFALFGIPFVLVGLHMMFGRFVLDARERGSTYYGVSDRRILIVSGRVSRNLASIELPRLPPLQLTEHRDGTGTITLLDPATRGRTGPRTWLGGDTRFPAGAAMFERVAEAVDVFRTIREAQAALSNAS